MPLYEYICSDCGLKFELLRPFSQANEATSCPSCHQNAERLLSNFVCFSSDGKGLVVPVSGGGSSCSSCGAASCDTCGAS